MSELYEIDGGCLRLNFHPGQLRAWDSGKRFIGIVAGTQSGKTSFLPLWLWREIRQLGPGDYGFFSPTFTLMEVKALPEFKRLFGLTLGLGSYVGSPVRRFTFSPEGALRVFRGTPWETQALDCPTHVYFGYAENSDSLESATYKAAVLDEAGQKGFRRESWEAILRRLSIHKGRACIGTTPYFAGGWLKSEIIDRAGLPGSDVELVNFPSTANPAFPAAEAERARRLLPAWKYDLFYRGIMTRPAGVVYDVFEARHRVPRFAIPAHWPRHVGLDFGGIHTAGIFLAEELAPSLQPTGRFFAYREYLPGQQRTAAGHVAALLAGEPRVPNAVGGSGSEDQWRAEFSAAGLPVRPPDVTGPDSVELGITRTYGAIKEDCLYVFDDLPGLLDELASYSREVDETGQPTAKIQDKESFHRLDSLRYIMGWLRRGALVWEAKEDESNRSIVSTMPAF